MLVTVKGRGGLWKVNNDTQKIFEICEIEFQRNKTKIMKYHKIDINKLCRNLLKNSLVQFHYYNIYSSISSKLSRENAVIYSKNLYCYIYVFEATHLPKM